ncbi:TPA: Bro-N domain-containing protein [Bacillus cereus]|nr:BRO family protein [Bacillus cereus]
MTNELKVIHEQEVLGQEFKVYGSKEEPLFLAKDVATWIDYDKSSVNKMINTVDEDEKVRKIVPTLGGSQESWLLTEDGLYEVLMQSRKPIAKQFKKKVKEILKDIRNHGMYMNDNLLEKTLADPMFMVGLLTNYNDEQNRIYRK